jgi:hypothetical protein
MRSNKKDKQQGATIDPQGLLTAGSVQVTAHHQVSVSAKEKSRAHAGEEDKENDAVSAAQDSLLEQGHVADKVSGNEEESDDDTAAFENQWISNAVDADEEADDEDKGKDAVSATQDSLLEQGHVADEDSDNEEENDDDTAALSQEEEKASDADEEADDEDPPHPPAKRRMLTKRRIPTSDADVLLEFSENIKGGCKRITSYNKCRKGKNCRWHDYDMTCHKKKKKKFWR